MGAVAHIEWRVQLSKPLAERIGRLLGALVYSTVLRPHATVGSGGTGGTGGGYWGYMYVLHPLSGYERLPREVGLDSVAQPPPVPAPLLLPRIWRESCRSSHGFLKADEYRAVL
jgi:hypothetical protein